MNRPAIGTISEATLIPAALVDSFEAEARSQGLEFSANYGAEDLDGRLEMLTEMLEEAAPAYTYFGTHSGDGANFGYWPDWDSIEMDRHTDARTGKLFRPGRGRAELPSGDELPDTAEGSFLVVSDHGNAELYAAETVAGRPRWVSQWSVV